MSRDAFDPETGLYLWQISDAKRIAKHLGESEHLGSSASVVRRHCKMDYYDDPAFWDEVERQLRAIRGR